MLANPLQRGNKTQHDIFNSLLRGCHEEFNLIRSQAGYGKGKHV